MGSTEDCPAEGATTYNTPNSNEKNALYNVHAVHHRTSRASLDSAERPIAQSSATSFATSSNQICESDLKGGSPTCTCVPMKRGQNCSEGMYMFKG